MVAKFKSTLISRSIKISLLLSCSFSALATTDTMVVTASGFEQELKNAPATISVISAKDLSERKFNDLAEALSDVEGVDVRSGMGKTGGLDISIRGMPSNYTLILVDGIRQSGADDVTPNGFGTMNTSFMPPLDSIERIEVIKGPMSTLYGSDAMGGVVNIITKKVSNIWHSSITAEHTLQQNSKFGDMSRLSLYTSGALIEDVLGIALRGNVFHRQASHVEASNRDVELSNKGPNPVKMNNYTLGGKLTWTPTTDNTLWLDIDIARQKYDNRNAQLGTLGGGNRGGYEKTLHYERNKFVVGSDNQFDFGQWNSSLTYNQVENKGRLITLNAVPGGSNRVGTPRQLKNENIIFIFNF